MGKSAETIRKIALANGNIAGSEESITEGAVENAGLPHVGVIEVQNKKRGHFY